MLLIPNKKHILKRREGEDLKWSELNSYMNTDDVVGLHQHPAAFS